MIISIGTFSSKIADLFVDSDLHKFTDESLNIKKKLDLKSYENIFLNDDDILIFNLDILREKKNLYILLDPDENISGISLKLIEYIKKVNEEIDIYVFLLLKDRKNLTKETLLNQLTNFAIYQDIARCGEIKRLFLLDLSLVITKFKIDLRNFQKSISESVYKIIRNCQFIIEGTPLYGIKFETSDIRRISTFGVLFASNLESLDNDEFFFYNFEKNFLGDGVFSASKISTEVFSEKHYIFYLSDNELSDGDSTLFKINSLLDSKGKNCSYSIFESGTQSNVFYIIKSTSYVEKPKD